MDYVAPKSIIRGCIWRNTSSPMWTNCCMLLIFRKSSLLTTPNSESFPFCTEHEWDQYCEDTEKLKPRPRKLSVTPLLPLFHTNPPTNSQGHFVCGWPINNVKQDGRAYFCSSIFPTVEALREHHDFHIYVFGRHSRATRLDLVPSLPVVWHEVVPFDHSIEDWIVDESFPHSLVPPPAGPVPPPPPPSPAPSGRVVRENAPPPVETEVSDEERSVLVKGSAAHKSLIALPAGGRTLYRRHSWP